MYEKENEKLKVQIANYILKEMKDYKDLHPPKEKRKILDIIPSALTRSEDIHGPIPYPNSKIKIYFNDTDVYNNKDLLKKFRLVSNKEYQYIDEDGIGKKEMGSEIFTKIQTKLFVQAQDLRTRHEIIIPNLQLSEDGEGMTRLRFQNNNANIKVESAKVRPVNHLYSLVKLDKERYVVWVYKKARYVNGRELAEKIVNGVDFKVIRQETSNKKEDAKHSFIDSKMSIQDKENKDELTPQPSKHEPFKSIRLKESIISKNIAKRISRKGRSLGMSWMNKIENETDQAIQEYLSSPGK